jgi:hypothetical protein
MLDHYFDGAVGAAVFRAEHVREHANEQAVTTALGQGPEALRAELATYGVASPPARSTPISSKFLRSCLTAAASSTTS